MIALVDGNELRAPAPGWFRRLVKAEHLVAPGDVIGELDVLGRIVDVVAPRVGGIVKLPAGHEAVRRPVSYGELLISLDGAIADAESPTQTARVAGGLVFRAPTSGRFYCRPAPGKPVFVASGTELIAGATVCLLEVMKTFHRVTYGGADLPARVRVRAVLVVDGADVNAGDPLVAIEAL